MKLDIGCGPTVHGDYDVGLDLIDYGGKVQQCDVRQGLPFDDDSIEAIRAAHFIEHLTQDEAVGFLNECWRVLRPGGEMVISTPHAQRSEGAFILQHRSYYTERAFKDLERAENWRVYGMRRWKVSKIVTNSRGDIHAWLEPVKKEMP